MCALYHLLLQGDNLSFSLHNMDSVVEWLEWLESTISNPVTSLRYVRSPEDSLVVCGGRKGSSTGSSLTRKLPAYITKIQTNNTQGHNTIKVPGKVHFNLLVQLKNLISAQITCTSIKPNNPKLEHDFNTQMTNKQTNKQTNRRSLQRKSTVQKSIRKQG